jgi:CrcB protein
VSAEVDSVVPRREWVTIAAIALGGALGAVARYEIGLAWPVVAGTFPWTTLAINLAGSIALGVVLTAFSAGTSRAARVRAFAAVGFCGGFTTFSTWMVEVVLLGRGGDVALGVAYSVTSIVLGLVAVALGAFAAHAVLDKRIPRFDPHLDD